jgi:signal transduction histidine kinase
MQITVRTKVVTGLAFILGVGTVSMLIIYYGLGALRDGMREIADVREPRSAAAYEMEINANGIALGVLKYLEGADPQFRRLVEDDQSDFERYHARYLRLFEATEREVLADSIGNAYREFKGLANQLMDETDRQEALFAGFGENLEQIDHLIDNRLQPMVDRQGPDGSAKVELLVDLEADIAEVAFWLANYQRTPRPEYKGLIAANEPEFRRGLALLKALRLTDAERRGVAELSAIRNRMATASRDILAAEDRIRAQTVALLALQKNMDRILDEKIQVLTLQGLNEPRAKAEASVDVVLDGVRFLLPVFFVSAAIVAILLITGITRPLLKLKTGAEAVRDGDLNHRIDVPAGDEFGDVARHFDEMVAKLQATMVSKELLEASQETLRHTVSDLRREILERVEAERERERLQTSLRQSETMAAIGALTAGVAHEVRNPLFGISSTLDAMDARFGERGDYQRYMPVLRVELDRLNQLMSELLEYSSPPAKNRTAGAIEAVIAEAIVACTPLAHQRGVALIDRVPAGLTPILMERHRMLQVFRNLIDNAVQHTTAGGHVTIEAGEVEGFGRAPWVECAVRDSGIGIDPEILARIFEPFFTRRLGGTGLGLSIVHRIVEEHGGQVAAANAKPDRGAVFTVRFPSAALTAC